MHETLADQPKAQGEQSDLLDLDTAQPDGLERPVLLVCLDAFDLLQHFHPSDQASEDGMLPIQPTGGHGGEEELRAVAVGPAVRHGDHPGLVVLEAPVELVVEEGRDLLLLALLLRALPLAVFPVQKEGRLASFPSAGRVSCLGHESLDNPVEDHVVVVLPLCQTEEVVAG